MANTDVSGQLSTAGMAFGDLVRLTGAAVASTQQQLNKTAADSTSALAKTLVDVIAVQEVDYDDNGTVTGAKTFTSQLPLIDVVDPVLYQWSQVRPQGRFTASQFATTASTGRSTSSPPPCLRACAKPPMRSPATSPPPTAGRASRRCG